jgi:hypothetical protein
MIRILTRAVRALTKCSCGAWYNTSDPAEWADHKHCR